MTCDVAHDRRKRTVRLGISRHRLVSHGPGGELDPIPRQHVCGHQLREARQRPASQLARRTGSEERLGESVRRAHVIIREPGHDLTSHDTPAIRNRRSADRASGAVGTPSDRCVAKLHELPGLPALVASR